MSYQNAPRFDRLAPYYDVLETFAYGRALRRAELALLDPLPFCEHVLVVGCGTGRFLVDLALAGRSGRIVCVDFSRGMLDRAQERYLSAGLDPQRVEFVQADVLHLPRNLRFDLVCANYFLDQFAQGELAPIVERLAGYLDAGGLFLFTDFVRMSARVRLSYLFFRLLGGISARRLPNYRTPLMACGLRPLLRRRAVRGTVESCVYERRPVAGKRPMHPDVRGAESARQTGSRSRMSTSAETI